MTTKRFEIWLADLAPQFGTEPGKRRPVLVIQNDVLNMVHSSTIVCPLTSRVRSGASILRVDVEQGISGLEQDSAVMIDQIRAIDNKRLIRKIGNLPYELNSDVEENVKIVLDL